MGKNVDCPCCISDARTAIDGDEPSLTAGALLVCEFCGAFRVTLQFMMHARERLSVDTRGRLAGVLHRFASANAGTVFPGRIDESNVEGIIARQGVPTNHAERIDELVRYVARAAPRYGERTKPETIWWWAVRAYTLNQEEIETILREYHDLFDFERPQEGFWTVRLTRAGWDRAHALASSRAESRTIFLASWYDTSVRTLFDPAMIAAAADLGLSHEFGNNLAEPRRIDDSIIAAIRRARVVVADFTGLRGGVYYEAGFAAGIGVPVIFTCHRTWTRFVCGADLHDASAAEHPEQRRETWRKGMHFDVAHFPIADWSSGEELKKIVVERVRAWALAAPGHAGEPIPG